MAQAADGVTITYQGKTCAPLFEYARNVGLEPDFGYVFTSLDEFKDYKIEESLSGVDSQPLPGVTQEKQATNRRGWQSSGDLVFTERASDNNGLGFYEHTVTIKKVLLSERAVESAFAFDDENDLCRIEITDIRYLWGKRGIVFGWFNVPKQGAGLPGEPDDPLLDGGLGANVQALKGGDQIFIQGSMKIGNAPWTLRQILVERVLPQLPGAPKLNRMPVDLETAIPVGHIWDGVLAKQALRDLLDEFQLVLALDLDSNVSLWKKNEGPSDPNRAALLEAGPDGTGRNAIPISVDTDRSPDPRVASAKRLVTFRWMPSTVVVLGPPIIVTERLRLEPVGEIRGTVLLLKDALEHIGLTMDKAQKFALSRYTDRTALPYGVTVDGVREFDRWGFKWFRIVGGPEANADKLPILNGRGATTGSGQLRPIKVFSESHTIVNVFATKLGATAAALIAKQIAEGNISGSGGSNPATPPANIGDKNDAEVLRLLKLQKGGGATATGGGGGGGGPSKIQKAAAQAARELLEQAGPEGYLVTHNVEFAEQTEGWELDHARGIVKFHTCQGLCVADGVELDTYKALLAPSAAVEIEFSHTLKPALFDDLDITHRYHSIWVRATNGGAGDATKVDQIPPGSAPLRIERPELQEIHKVSGVGNKDTLDGIAQKLVSSVFSAPQSQAGMVVTFGRPVRIVNSGQALSIRWFTDNERPRVEVHVNTFAPLAPDPDLRTRAFGLPMGRGRSMDSVIAPRGLTR